jgi:TrpR-related protein YerC/YecD
MEKEIDITELIEGLGKLKNKDEIKAFLSDILTKSEQQTLLMRLRVAKLLDDGSPYKQIEKETGASSATIAKISEYLKYGYDGYRIVLDRTKKK